MSVPFTIGRLIDYFTLPSPVRHLPWYRGRVYLISRWQELFWGLTPTMAAGGLFGIFLIGGLANMGRSLLMRMSGQRIVARLRRQAYAGALKQEVDYIERAEGDVLSRLSVDTSIVGESGELMQTCRVTNVSDSSSFESHWKP